MNLLPTGSRYMEASFSFSEIWTLYSSILGQATPSAFGHYDSAETVTISQDAGETVAYLFNGCNNIVVSRATPEIDEDITYFHYGSWVDINVRHSVGTPVFGDILPNIDYDFDIRVYEAAITTISGQHDGFPDYEVYRSIGQYIWDQLYHWDASKEGQSIYSLIDPMEIEI